MKPWLLLVLLALLPALALAQPAPPPPPTGKFAPALAGAGITDVQRLLAAHGYKPGPPTGRMNEATGRAIRDYQRDAHLPQDGEASPALENHLRFTEPKVMARPPGRDPVAAAAQEELKRLGYYQGRVDGVAGKGTRDALARFQADRQMQVDGRITSQTLADLRAAQRQ